MIEIERKFVLKALPEIKPVEIIKIDQFYFKNGDIWEGEALFPVNLSSDDIVNAWLSPSSDTPSLLNFPVGQLCPLVWGMKSIKI